jgi:hypothetical protein
MKHKLVHYKVKPEAVTENRRLVEAVLPRCARVRPRT